MILPHYRLYVLYMNPALSKSDTGHIKSGKTTHNCGMILEKECLLCRRNNPSLPLLYNHEVVVDCFWHQVTLYVQFRKIRVGYILVLSKHYLDRTYARQDDHYQHHQRTSNECIYVFRLFCEARSPALIQLRRGEVWD